MQEMIAKMQAQMQKQGDGEGEGAHVWEVHGKLANQESPELLH